MEQFVQMMTEEQMQQNVMIGRLASSAETAIQPRPTEHYLRVTQNGTIIEATETITGLSPNKLLMTSIYDGVYHEDLLGLRAIKEKIWDTGKIRVEVRLRRKTAEGTWVWLVSRVASVDEHPVPSFVLHEYRVKDEELASFFGRLTWIIASLAEALEKPNGFTEKVDSSAIDSHRVNNFDTLVPMIIPGLADDASKLQELLESAANSGTDIESSSGAKLQQIIDAAARVGAPPQDSPSPNDKISKIDVLNSSSTIGKKGVVIPSVLDLVTSGPCVNISNVELSLMDLKIVTLVLKGEVQIGKLAQLILENVKSPGDLSIIDDLIETPDIKVCEEEELTQREKKGTGDTNQQQKTPKINNLNDSTSEAVSKSKDSCIGNSSNSGVELLFSLPLHKSLEMSSPAISSINLSCSRIGNQGLEKLSELIYCDTPFLKMLNLSFCNVEERGILAMCRSLRKRKKRGLPGLQGLILSGNEISYKSAKELGLALCLKDVGKACQMAREPILEGYDEDNEGGREEDDDDEDDVIFGADVKGSGKRRVTKKVIGKESKKERKLQRCSTEENSGIQLLHLASTSLSSEALAQLMLGLGEDSQIRELNISSNNIGADGTCPFVNFLEGKIVRNETKKKRQKPVMPKLDRIDLSNNNLGDNGTATLTRAISKRGQPSMVDLYLSFNNIGSGGTETIMNKLLQHNVVTLFLDNNIIGDKGCKLVAGSLSSMHHLSRLNLSFNQIGSRGITSLMRALIGCESITYLGLSGNVMKISGAIAMGFALAQHPRLAHLEVDNCCLSEVAQCHIVSGIISNRWVPMRNLHGFRVAPPMDVIGVPEVRAWHLNNEGFYLSNKECFSNRRNIQMKTILQWMESSTSGTGTKSDVKKSLSDSVDNFLTVDYVSSKNNANTTPSQNAYLRMLDWLSRIPFDEDELNDLRRYFYDADDGGDGLRGSDGNINLKHRGDLLAALGSGLVEKMRQDDIKFPDGPAVGLGIDSDTESNDDDYFGCLWNGGRGMIASASDDIKKSSEINVSSDVAELSPNEEDSLCKTENNAVCSREKRQSSTGRSDNNRASNGSFTSMGSKPSEDGSASTNSEEEQKTTKSLKARITMFPVFMQKLELLKLNTQRMMNEEVDGDNQDIIATLFAEKSLTMLRQLRYHCMNNGLDGWRQGKIRRKVLIVDDSRVTRKLVARAFEKANFIVDTAENGEEGVRRLKESIYDIAFMDINMPVMNGFDATKALREWEDTQRPGARQPICALTAAYVDDFEKEELMKFKEAGLDVMESKPCNIPRLFKVVDDVSPMFSDLNISITQQLDSAQC